MITLRATVATATVVLGILVAACADDPTPIHDLAAVDSGAVIEGGSVLPEGGGLLDASTRLGGQIDRVGRPTIAIALLPTSRRDAYNRLGPADSTFAFTPDFEAGLVAMDQLDGVQDWGAAPHPAVAPMLVDALLVDTTKPYSASGFLEIENELMAGGPAHTTCGGRTPQEDAVDKLYSFLIKKKLTGVSDGVSAPTKAATTTFPYLASPD